MSKVPSLSETIRLDLPASLKYLNVLGACLTAMLARVQSMQNTEIAIYNIQLALHEICTNIMVHAYAHLSESGRIEVIIALNLQENSLKIELFDNGEPFDESKIGEPDLDHGQVHGYGLFLAKHLMDSVKYERQDQRNAWSLTKLL